MSRGTPDLHLVRFPIIWSFLSLAWIRCTPKIVRVFYAHCLSFPYWHELRVNFLQLSITKLLFLVVKNLLSEIYINYICTSCSDIYAKLCDLTVTYDSLIIN